MVVILIRMIVRRRLQGIVLATVALAAVLALGWSSASGAAFSTPSKRGWSPSFAPADSHDFAAIQRVLASPAAADLRREIPMLDGFIRLNPASELDQETAGPLVARVLDGFGLESEKNFRHSYLRAAEDVATSFRERSVELLGYIRADTMDSRTLSAESASIKRARSRFALYDQDGAINTITRIAVNQMVMERAKRMAIVLAGAPPEMFPLPYWEIARPTPGQLQSLNKALKKHQAAKQALAEHLARVQPLLDRSQTKFDAQTLAPDTGLKIVDGSLELAFEVRFQPLRNARTFFERLCQLPQFGGLAQATDVEFWRRKYWLQDKAARHYLEVLERQNSLFSSWSKLLPKDKDYLERAEQDLTFGKAPADHFFYEVLQLPHNGFVSTKEGRMLYLLEKSRKINMDRLHGLLETLQYPRERTSIVLHSAMPLIYHSLEMPLPIRLRFRQIVASYVYGLGWKMTPYQHTNLSDWIDVPGAQFAQEMRRAFENPAAMKIPSQN